METNTRTPLFSDSYLGGEENLDADADSPPTIRTLTPDSGNSTKISSF